MDITLGYSKKQDRVWLKSGDQVYWLTRRLIRQLLGPCAAALEQSAPPAVIPNALPSTDRVAMDHSEAVGDNIDGNPGLEMDKVRASDDALANGRLMTVLAVNVDNMKWTLEFRDDRIKYSLLLNRLELHRFLGAIIKVLSDAEWDLGDLPSWLTSN